MKKGINDCVFCSNESDNAPDGELCPWCDAFGEPIANNAGFIPSEHKYSHSGRAQRSQDSCSSFELDPRMESQWHSRFD